MNYKLIEDKNGTILLKEKRYKIVNEEYINYNELEDMEYLCNLLEQRDADIKTFKFTIKMQQQMIYKLISKIDNAIEYIKEHTDKLKTTRIPKIDFNYNEVLELLGDKE